MVETLRILVNKTALGGHHSLDKGTNTEKLPRAEMIF